MLTYDFYYTGYLAGYLTIDDAKQGVVNGDITQNQFKEITGQDYTP